MVLTLGVLIIVSVWTLYIYFIIYQVGLRSKFLKRILDSPVSKNLASIKKFSRFKFPFAYQFSVYEIEI